MKIQIDSTTYLETVKLSDAKEVFDLVENSRDSLRQWLPWVDFTKSTSDIESYFQTCIDRKKANNGFDLTINLNDKIVGIIGLHKIDHLNKLTSIGYWLPKQNEGKGFMTKSVQALCNYCFTNLNLNRIEIACATDNIKSQNIPKRLNFKLEGTLRQREIINGKHLDHFLFSLLKSENSN
tara:strand:+ start:54 stop:593 length:540 start_codon:yes stop_codon:yes gene_type:complete